MSMTGNTLGAATAQTGFVTMLRASFRAHGLFFGLVGVYYAAVLYFLNSEPLGFLVTTIASIIGGLVVMIFATFMVRFVTLAINERPDQPIKAIARDMWSLMSDRRRLAVGIPMIAVLAPFMTIFGEFKAAVPMFNGGFVWDQAFNDLDRWLHFGTLPWQWLQPVLGYPPITFAINFSYNFWFFGMWMVWAVWAFTTRPDANRTHFFLTFMLLWSIGGSLMAIQLSSAGPAFYTLIGLSPDPYTPLMQYLQHADQFLPVWALDTQAMLWTGFNGRTVADGISAMPSMHNASSLLFVLTARHLGKWPFRLLAAHCFLIFIGSVHLAWHYAIDAYVGWALTLVLWFATKPIAEWWDRRPAANDLREVILSYEAQKPAA
ncbi:MAG: phosphatase PAP2 family protein [Aestuariivirgaceae bacterium]